MVVPIYANMNLMIKNKNFFTTIDQRIIYLFIYFSVATIAFYSYMALLTANPKIG